MTFGYFSNLAKEHLQNVDRRWHSEFLRFVETGEAGDEFLQYLNDNKGGQQAVEMAFNAQATAFEDLAEELKKGPQPLGSPGTPGTPGSAQPLNSQRMTNE